jgi:hypothetical protein
MAIRLAVREMKLALADCERSPSPGGAASLFSRMAGAANSLKLAGWKTLYDSLPPEVSKDVFLAGLRQGLPEATELMTSSGKAHISLAVDEVKSTLDSYVASETTLDGFGVSDAFLNDFGRGRYELREGDTCRPIEETGARDVAAGRLRAEHNLPALKALAPHAAQLRTVSVIAQQHAILPFMVVPEFASMPGFEGMNCLVSASKQAVSFVLERQAGGNLKLTATATKSFDTMEIDNEKFDSTLSSHMSVEVLINPDGTFEVIGANYEQSALQIKGGMTNEMFSAREAAKRNQPA